MTDNANIDVKVKIGEFQVLMMDSNREIWVLFRIS